MVSGSTKRCHIADIRAPARSNTMPAMSGLVWVPFTTISARSSGIPAFWESTSAVGKVSWMSRSAPSHASTRYRHGRVSPENTTLQPA